METLNPACCCVPLLEGYFGQPLIQHEALVHVPLTLHTVLFKVNRVLNNMFNSNDNLMKVNKYFYGHHFDLKRKKNLWRHYSRNVHASVSQRKFWHISLVYVTIKTQTGRWKLKNVLLLTFFNIFIFQVNTSTTSDSNNLYDLWPCLIPTSVLEISATKTWIMKQSYRLLREAQWQSP